MYEIVDRALELSRATLVRNVRGVLLRFAPIPGIATAADPAMSRASLETQGPDITSDSAENLATPSRVTLGSERAS